MQARSKLNDFMSIQCFKAAIKGMEELLTVEGAAAAMIAAGRIRGQELASETGLAGTKPTPEELQAKMNKAIGVEGTRLCMIREISKKDDGSFLVKAEETVCSAGEPSGSTRKCTFTLGAITACVEEAYGIKLTAKQVASVLSGSQTDDFLLTPYNG
jgi:hypothetical protein